MFQFCFNIGKLGIKFVLLGFLRRRKHMIPGRRRTACCLLLAACCLLLAACCLLLAACCLLLAAHGVPSLPDVKHSFIKYYSKTGVPSQAAENPALNTPPALPAGRLCRIVFQS